MSMKKSLSFLLAAAMLLACTACGTASNAAESLPQEIPDKYEALSADLKEAFQLGIAGDELLTRLEETEPCTQKEATTLLCNAFHLRRTQESLYLKDMLEHAKTDKAASRYWIAQGMYFANLEDQMDIPYTDYQSWMERYGDFTEEVPENIRLPDGGFAAPDPATGKITLWGCLWDGACKDNNRAFDAPNAVKYEDCGSHWITSYAAILYDRTNGDRVMTMDENSNFNPQASTSMEEAIIIALRYYRSFENEQVPIAFADVGRYDSQMISDDVLSRESALPDASCEHLPAEWHGVLVGDMASVCVGCLSNQVDRAIYENDIKAIRDAGFNYVGLMTSFSYLQGPELHDGMFNESRLRELDQFIGWCLKYDLHVEIRCSDPPGIDVLTRQDDSWAIRDEAINTSNPAAIQDFAAAWGALAKRYQGISNRDLSFNLMVEPGAPSEEGYAAFFAPAIEAIRAQTPDRCIISDVHYGGLTGESMAKLGVALSYHLYEPRDFCAPPAEITQEEMQAATWPYTAADGRVIDAKQVMEELGSLSISANDLIATAKEYNVGVMIGEFGTFAQSLDANYWYPVSTTEHYLQDMVTEFKAQGVGWCYGVWNGPSGIVADVPLIDDATYEKLKDTTLYLNTDMKQMWQRIFDATA